LSALEDKSFAFALKIVRQCEFLQQERKEFVLSKQLLRSGTAIGALLAEGKYAQSRMDFINKLSISLKEANETKYWLRLLKETGYLQEETAINLLSDIEAIIRMLASSVKTSKERTQ